MAISDFKPRPSTKRTPYGYLKYPDFIKKGGDPSLASSVEEMESYVFPDPVVIPLLDAALDQLDAGISLREACEWLNNEVAKTNPSLTLSHEGLKGVRKRVRPNHVKYEEKVKARPENKRLTRLERMAFNRKRKIAEEKRQLTARKKRVQRQEEELRELLGEDKQTVFEIPEQEYDYTSIPEEESIIFKPNPGPQTAFLAASEREVLYGGAAFGGKSFALLADPMRYFDNPNFNGLLLRRTNDELRELIWKSQSLYKAAYPKARWSEKKSSWTFPAGGHLWFTYCERDEDVMRYQGQAFTWIGFDELTQYPTPFAWDYLRSRLRTTDPELVPYLSMRATTNPGGPGHGWVKKMFIDPAPYGKAFPATDLDTGEPLLWPEGSDKAGKPLFYRRFIPAKLYDNPYAGEEYEANLRSLPEHQRRQLLEGDWTVAEGAAFPEFRLHKHVCEPFDMNAHDTRDWFKFRSCDYGYSERQASAVHWYAVEPSTGTLYVYRELYVNRHTGTQLAHKILELERGERISYGVLDSSVWAQRGQTGPSIAEEMIRAGCKWKPSDRSPGSRIASKNRLHELLREDEYTGKPGIIFFNTCRQIIADLPVIPMSKDDDDIDRKYATDHAYDSIRYGIQSRPKKSAWNDPFSGNYSRPIYRPQDPVFGY